MNKQRRETISKAIGLLEEAKSFLETARDEEQEYFDNMPESLQGSERGEQAEAAISCLEDAISEIESARDKAEEATSN